MANLAVVGAHVYAPNPHKEEAFEDGVVMAINPEMTHAMIEFSDDDPVIVELESLEPACESCGGMRAAECCDDPQ